MTHTVSVFWSVPAADLLDRLRPTPAGLVAIEAAEHLARYGANLCDHSYWSDRRRRGAHEVDIRRGIFGRGMEKKIALIAVPTDGYEEMRSRVLDAPALH